MLVLIVLKSGDKFVHRLKNGEGLLYELVEDMVNPIKLVKTMSKDDVQIDDNDSA